MRVGTGVETLQDFCWRVLACGDLASKLCPAPDGLVDRALDQPIRVSRPARNPALALSEGAPRLPRLAALVAPEARARCLARFAHHELMAVELFAWALLRWPDVPDSLRRGWLAVLGEEQLHCRLYLEQLAALGSDFADHPVSDYFWRQLPSIDASPAGPCAFLCAMGLTLEQANLDFTQLYAEAFRQAGDDAGAEVLERVHADEVRHVALAMTWLRRLGEEGRNDVELYEAAVPFPLSAARAKGRRFDAEARRRAGLAPELIAHVRAARSTTENRRRS